MKKDVKTIIFVVIGLLAIFLWGYLFGLYMQKSKQEKVVEEKIKEVYIAEEGLSEWTTLQMAIMKTESEFDPSQIGATNDLGINQITPIFVSEVNRILGKEVYSHLDAFDIRKSIEMFNIVQGYHNKEHSISKTITVQNPGGASIGYGKRVYDNIRFIKRMEEARKELIKYEVEQKLKENEESSENT